MRIKAKQTVDHLSIEVFVIDETFESLFNALKGVYFRLYFKESKNVNENLKRKNFYLKKFDLISNLKSSIKPDDYPGKKEAVTKYTR